MERRGFRPRTSLDRPPVLVRRHSEESPLTRAPVGLGNRCIACRIRRPNIGGVFHGRPFNEANLTPVELLSHVIDKYKPWVDEEITKLELKECIVRYTEVAYNALQPWPRICSHLGVSPKLRVCFGLVGGSISCANTHRLAWTEKER